MRRGESGVGGAVRGEDCSEVRATVAVDLLREE